jgi:hypothetical protein
MLELLMSGAGAGSGDWEFVASTATSGSMAANTSVAFPAGYQPGDAVLALLSGYSNSYLPHPAAPPPGWEEVVSDRHTVSTSPNYYVHLLPKITGQTAYQNPNVGSALRCAFVLVVLRPVGVPVDAMSARLVNETARFQTAADAFPNPPELVTTTRRNRIIAVGVTHRQAQTFTAAPGFTILGQSNGATWAIGFIAWADALQEEAGAVDPGAFSHATIGDWLAATISLRTQATSGTVRLNGSFASAVSELFSGTHYVASPTAITVSAEGSASISLSGGIDPGYRINGGAWTSAPGTVNNGDVIELRQASVALSSGQTQSNTTTAAIGNKTASFTLITRRELVLIGSSVSWTVPAGVSALSVTGTGGGGSAGGGWDDPNSSAVRGGGGGGGGAMSRTPALAVNAGDVLTITAGLRGASVGEGVAGNPGGDSSIVRSGSTLWLAKGGSGGARATSGANGSGGAGGSATNSIGTTRYSGGNGGNGVYHSSGVCYPGGGGGGAGGYTGNGGAGANGNSTTTRRAGGNGAGGAGAGGESEHAGGGTGVSGAGANGIAPGGVGSPDDYATGVSGTSLNIAGVSGGGGSCKKFLSITGSAGGHGAVRTTW